MPPSPLQSRSQEFGVGDAGGAWIIKPSSFYLCLSLPTPMDYFEEFYLLHNILLLYFSICISKLPFLLPGLQFPVLDLSGGWGFNPLWCLSTPSKFVLNPKKIVKISKKYIADPLWFSHKSSTVDPLSSHSPYILSLPIPKTANSLRLWGAL